MCGILVVIPGVLPKFTTSLIKDLFNRGPDSQNLLIDPKISLFHTRLAILDPTSQANQPMISEDGNYVLIYNGEIYNHLEIRESLISKHNFKSSSDTETLLYGYIEYGKEILNKINGIFSFIIYNKLNGTVFIARDPFGVKPFYYFLKDGTFIGGSEIKAFVSHPFFDPTLHPESFLNYTTLLFAPGAGTPYKYVSKLLPGHYMEFKADNPSELTIQKYFDIPFRPYPASGTPENLLIKQLEEKLYEAVERQMLSDVPVGFFLSGGLDSSTIVTLARNIYPSRDFQCFTINDREVSGSEGIKDDLPYARKVSQLLKVNLEEIKIHTDILELFDFMVYHLDEPIADPAALHVYNISKRAREMGYKVLLSGTGGDEIFSGYRRHQAVRIEKFLQYTPSSLLQLLALGCRLYPTAHPLRRRIEKLGRSMSKPGEERLIDFFFWLDPRKALSLFSPAVLEKIGKEDMKVYFKRLLGDLPPDTDDLSKMLYLDQKTYLPDNNLTYTDKMSMAAGVEVRVPFLDNELAEFSYQIPSSLKMKGTTTKYLLRKLMEKYLPREIVYRAKTGFGAPVRRWIREDLDPKVKVLPYSEVLLKSELFNHAELEKFIRENQSGKIDASYPLWALLCIESWLRQFPFRT